MLTTPAWHPCCRYLNYDDTRAAKARARNGEDAVVLDYDTWGDKFGQLAAVSNAGFRLDRLVPHNVRCSAAFGTGKIASLVVRLPLVNRSSSRFGPYPFQRREDANWPVPTFRLGNQTDSHSVVAARHLEQALGEATQLSAQLYGVGSRVVWRSGRSDEAAFGECLNHECPFGASESSTATSADTPKSL